MSMNPVLKIGKSEVNPLLSPSGELGVSSGSEEEDGWGKKVRMKLMPVVYTAQVCSLKTMTVKNEFDANSV